MRVLQMCVPVLGTIIWLAFWIIKRNNVSWRTYVNTNPIQTIIATLCLYVILKGSYNFIFVDLFLQGHWYYPLSIMVFNFLIAYFFYGFISKISFWQGKWIVNLISILVIVLYGNSFISEKIKSGYNNFSYKFWIHRQEIESTIKQISNNSGIIEYDDGIISFSLDIPTMSGFGFTLDNTGYKAKQSGKLLELAYQRNFRIIGVVNRGYLRFPDGFSESSNDLRKLFLNDPFLLKENINSWDFKIIYTDPDTKAIFIEFYPREKLNLEK